MDSLCDFGFGSYLHREKECVSSLLVHGDRVEHVGAALYGDQHLLRRSGTRSSGRVVPRRH